MITILQTQILLPYLIYKIMVRTYQKMKELMPSLKYVVMSIPIVVTMISTILAVGIVHCILGSPSTPTYIAKSKRWNKECIQHKYKQINSSIHEHVVRWKKKSKEILSWKIPPSNIRDPNVWSVTKRTAGILYCFISMQETSVRVASNDIFSSDTFSLVVDSACSYCITSDAKHFIDTPRKIKMIVKGIGGQEVLATMVGTVEWSFTNDQG